VTILIRGLYGSWTLMTRLVVDSVKTCDKTGGRLRCEPLRLVTRLVVDSVKTCDKTDSGLHEDL